MATTQTDTGFEARRKSYNLLVEKVDTGKSLTPSELTSMMRFEKELEKTGNNIPDFFATTDQVATYSGYKVRTIYNAIKANKLTKLSDGTFPRADVDKWLAKKGRLPQVAAYNNDTQDQGEDAPQSHGARFEETRYRKARADREELLVARLKGQLVEVEEVEQQFTARAHEYKTSLLLLSRRCAHKIAAAAGMESKEITKILDEEAKQLLKTLCRKVKLDVN